LQASELYTDLHDGDGVCRYFDSKSRLCGCYEDRPLVCRVDDMYFRYFSEVMPLEKYYRLNADVCLELQQKDHLSVYSKSLVGTASSISIDSE
jgi:hypothetical protein